jgi:hypothetical protein
MNYEFNDYRKPKKPKLGSWPFWTVPEFYAIQYLFRLVLVILVIPYLFGFQLTPIGVFFLFVVWDYVTYRSLKTVYELE